MNFDLVLGENGEGGDSFRHAFQGVSERFEMCGQRVSALLHDDAVVSAVGCFPLWGFAHRVFENATMFGPFERAKEVHLLCVQHALMGFQPEFEILPCLRQGFQSFLGKRCGHVRRSVRGGSTRPPCTECSGFVVCFVFHMETTAL